MKLKKPRGDVKDVNGLGELLYPERMQPYTICTAGHIDHGKTALVKALTGTDTDRLKEEKARGITIELGYAFLNDNIAFVDVPGHVRFIKNMAAGAAAVDFALLVVAADDGIMPQTREHFDILRLLGISDGVVAVTKCDMADEEWIDLVEADIREMVKGSFLEERPLVRMDSLSGRGVEELRDVLLGLAGKKKRVDGHAVFRLPVDRVFSVKGFGTVVTGSALSGTVSLEDRLTLLPDGQDIRVRGIESQGKSLNRAVGGMRVALNIAPASVEELSRGDILVTPGHLRPTFMLDTSLSILEGAPVSLCQRDRVRVHLGCAEIMARAVILDKDEVHPGETGLVQLRLESMTAAARTDRFVIRRYSPQLTIGGGQVLDANPKKHRKREKEAVLVALNRLRDSGGGALIEGILAEAGYLSWAELVSKSAMPDEEVEDAIADMSVKGRVIELEAKGKRQLISVSLLEKFNAAMTGFLTSYHRENSLRLGAQKGEILRTAARGLPEFIVNRLWKSAIEDDVLKAQGNGMFSLVEFSVQLNAHQGQQLELLEGALKGGRFAPPDSGELAGAIKADEKTAKGLLQVLVDRGVAVAAGGKVFFHADAVQDGIGLLRRAYETKESLSMSEFRQLLDTSRKYALPLINHYDNHGVTLRRNDDRLPGPNLRLPEY